MTLDWREARRAAKLCLVTPLVTPEATFEVPFGTVTRPADGTEQPGQSWVSVTGRRPGAACLQGVMVLCDAKSSVSVRGSTLEVTIARSPAFAHHDPFVLGTVAPEDRQDQGEPRSPRGGLAERKYPASRRVHLHPGARDAGITLRRPPAAPRVAREALTGRRSPGRQETRRGGRWPTSARPR
ncbi:glycoside hydrolase family 38 C-terminal domain-containing protein [Deinococcus planocerae]|uniref:glycoside hydrolase family 38 C-terminal domain-containing protein n=1 Tax=Deinococcus planocerae TaxID=1737569 RepID=UPI0011AF7500|nr:glycoside hydrolase family 38 C-terminal domain-containing protein [Deinococcus planocerae]